MASTHFENRWVSSLHVCFSCLVIILFPDDDVVLPAEERLQKWSTVFSAAWLLHRVCQQFIINGRHTLTCPIDDALSRERSDACGRSTNYTLSGKKQGNSSVGLRGVCLTWLMILADQTCHHCSRASNTVPLRTIRFSSAPWPSPLGSH